MPEDLSKRESEILAELVGGRRISTIAEHFFISPHTVRNHLRGIFGKLGVHSQAELVEYVRQNPSVLGEHARRDGQGLSSDELISAYKQANERVSSRIDTILAERWGPDGLREMMRAVLPHDDATRAEWRIRLDLWSRERDEPVLLDRRTNEMARSHARAGP